MSHEIYVYRPIGSRNVDMHAPYRTGVWRARDRPPNQLQLQKTRVKRTRKRRTRAHSSNFGAGFSDISGRTG